VGNRAVSERELPPYPVASRPPSPARGEGKKLGVNPQANRAKFKKLNAASRRRQCQASHSPLAGEGAQRVQSLGKRAARRLRAAMTDAEQALWRVLRSRQFEGHKFRRQAPLGPYIADFCCFEARLIIEVDGGQHSGSAADEGRDVWFEAQNFRVIRFWNHEVLSNIEGVAEKFTSMLVYPPLTRPASRRPSPASCRRHAAGIRGESKEEAS